MQSFGEDGKVAPVPISLVWTTQGWSVTLSLKTCRVEYVAATDDEAVEALLLLSKTEGILPAIESSHAIAEAGQNVHN